MELLKEVLEEIQPDESKIKKEVNDTLKKLNLTLKRNKITAKAITGGSIAKGTFLKGDHDCDVFVRFDYKKYKDETGGGEGKEAGEGGISDILGKALEKAFGKGKVDRLHGSRDYYQMKDSIKYEIIPVLEIKKFKEAKNITDCSPMHVLWVNKFPKMKKDIMLTKAFMKSAGVYGAESYVKGFSGHVVDILTIYSKGFLNLLKQSQKWKTGQVIDYYNYHKGKAMMNINRSKTQSALIIVDPIDPYRNASAVLSAEKFGQFRKRAAEFLKKPSKEFFFAERFDIEKIKKKAEGRKERLRLMIIDAKALDGKEDVVGAKLLKVLEFIESQLKQNDFNVIESGWNWDRAEKAVFWIMTSREDLPEMKTVEGPPVKLREYYENFRKVHKDSQVFEKNG
ncbi:MAG: nucleotidyltransferase domain-containing protein, partial [Candidatus Woesearchaeota archaeon]|nr:nucleotidyltransferase domain-containing protein [Candidatus Woesearchaeota archaeon]